MMLSRRIALALVVAMGLTLVAPAAPYAAPDAGKFVSDLGDKAIKLLTDKDAQLKDQELRFRELLREGFAIEPIAKFVLGPHLRRASDAEVTEFVGLFEDYIVSLYASQFRNYSGETFQVRRVVDLETKRGDLQVVTEVMRGGGQPPLRVDFQVRPVQDSFKILDVKIEGVSMIIAQRDDFSTFITNNGGKVQALNAELRKKTASLLTRASSPAN
ncbi:MAG: phospholipid-binding protein MlaC [Alphaproteobacteria bacterium]